MTSEIFTPNGVFCRIELRYTLKIWPGYDLANCLISILPAKCCRFKCVPVTSVASSLLLLPNVRFDTHREPQLWK